MNTDLQANDLEAKLLNVVFHDWAIQSAQIDLDDLKAYCTLSWDLFGGSPSSVRTEAERPQKSSVGGERPIVFNSVQMMKFEREKKAKETHRFFLRGRMQVELTSVPTGKWEKWFGGGEERCVGRGEFKPSQLIEKHSVTMDVPLRAPGQDEFSPPLCHLKIAMRIRHSLESKDPGAVRVSMPSSGATSGGKARVSASAASSTAAAPAIPEETENDFAQRLVSYNVIEWELGRIANGTAPLPRTTKEAVSLGMGNLLQQALEMRKEMLQLQVDTGQLTIPQYLEGLKKAIEQEKQRSKKYKVLPGGAQKALDAFKHAKIMMEELSEAQAGLQ